MEITERQQLKLAKLALVRKLEEQVMLLKYQKDPLLWLKERFGESTTNMQWSKFPEYEGHVWDGSKDPFVNAWLDISKGLDVGIESCTGAGKTYYASRIALWFLDVFPDSLVVTIGPTFSQLKDNLWSEISKGFKSFKKIRQSAALTGLRLSVMGGTDDKSWQMIARYALANSRTQSGEDAEKSMTKAAGFHRKDMLFLIDEAPGVADPMWNSIYQTMTGGNNIIAAFGNPDSEIDALHRFCMKKTTKHYIVSGYDHPNVVIGREIIEGAVTRKSIQKRMDDYGENSNFFNSRVRGLCPSRGKNSLFDLKMLKRCVEGNVQMDDSFPALGMDVANSKDGDKASTGFGVRNCLVELYSFQCENAGALADNVVFDDDKLLKLGIVNYQTRKLHEFAIHETNIVVDGAGVGVSTMNRFEFLGYNVTTTTRGVDKDRIPKDQEGKLLYNYNSFRCQLVCELADDVNKGLINLSLFADNPTLYQTIKVAMSIIQMKVIGGKIYITTKDEMKKYLSGQSPDEFDALVYWNYARKIKPKTNDGMALFSVSHV